MRDDDILFTITVYTDGTLHVTGPGHTGDPLNLPRALRLIADSIEQGRTRLTRAGEGPPPVNLN